MNDIIKLDNNYYIEILNKNHQIPINIVNVYNVKLIKVCKKF